MTPRRVPVSLQIVNYFNAFTQIGWAIFGFAENRETDPRDDRRVSEREVVVEQQLHSFATSIRCSRSAA